ncbi:hypothetical protein [Hymenobacter coccineus]|uniref:hypothetical protein n=1 Tax=Hymenobacter coccineus TaxID=1908235 RepID=UPI000F7AB39B|nr:hypothetical protein [Hymenobacter coccineus]
MSPETISLTLSMRAKCISCGVENIFPTVVTIPVNLDRPLLVPAGDVIADGSDRCPVCNGEVRTMGGLFQFRNGQLEHERDMVQLRREWHIMFTSCTINSQEYGSNNEHMVSRVNFIIKPGDDFFDEHRRSISCTVCQAYGENYTFETSPLEVENPPELVRKINYSEFQFSVERYFRSVLGNNGGGFRLNNAHDIAMRNMTFDIEGLAVIHAAESGSAAW